MVLTPPMTETPRIIIPLSPSGVSFTIFTPF